MESAAYKSSCWQIPVADIAARFIGHRELESKEPEKGVLETHTTTIHKKVNELGRRIDHCFELTKSGKPFRLTTSSHSTILRHERNSISPYPRPRQETGRASESESIISIGVESCKSNQSFCSYVPKQPLRRMGVSMSESRTNSAPVPLGP